MQNYEDFAESEICQFLVQAIIEIIVEQESIPVECVLPACTDHTYFSSHQMSAQGAI